MPPPDGVEVAAHAGGVDHHAFGDGAGMGDGAAGEHEGLRKGEEFGLPGAGAAFVVVGHGALHERDQGLDAALGGDDVFRRDRIALLRHGR